MSLRARLTTAFLVVVLGPVLLGAVFIGAAVDTLTLGRASDRLDAAAAAVSTTVSAACDRLTATAGAVALLYSSSGDELKAGAQRAVAARQASAVAVSDADGRSVAVAGEPPEHAEAAAECGTRPSDTDTTILMLTAQVRIHDDSSVLRGTVSAWVPVDADFVAELAAAADGPEVTVDDGRDVPLSSFSSTADAQESVTVARDAAGESPVSTSRSDRVVRAVSGTASAPVPLVLAVDPQPVNGLIGILIAVVAGAAVLAVGAAAWLARSTTRPLAELVTGADGVAQGDLSVRVPVRGTDELATLARTFNRMARETQGYVSALTASRDQLRGQLTLLGETLSSTLDLDRILEVIVDTATAVTGARSGVMLVIDPEDPRLLYGHEGPIAGAANSPVVRVGIGDGLLGSVAADKRPMRGRVGVGTPVRFAESEPTCATYIAVPVMAVVDTGAATDSTPPAPVPGGLLGVLAIYDRLGGDDFDDADLSTLQTFAGQAAVAVGNVLSHREVQRLSLTDPLTGLWNYRYLQVSLAREVERAGRFHRSAAVIAIDLDRFKVVNDTYGHPVGDVVLKEVARRISAEIREVDLAFRYGGEEFVVLLPEADVDGAGRVAERLSRAVGTEPIDVATPSNTHDTPTVSVTVSLGVAVFPDHGNDGAAVLAAADEALYAAKAAGRDTWRVAKR